MDDKKSVKRVRTSVFLEPSLIAQAKQRAGTHGNFSDIIRGALMLGLNELDRLSTMFQLKNDVLQAAANGEFARGGEVIDRMAASVGRPSTDQLKRAVNEALAKKDFARAHWLVRQLEFLQRDWSATAPDLEELYEALEDEEFDIARTILDALRQKREVSTTNDG